MAERWPAWEAILEGRCPEPHEGAHLLERVRTALGEFGRCPGCGALWQAHIDTSGWQVVTISSWRASG